MAARPRARLSGAVFALAASLVLLSAAAPSFADDPSPDAVIAKVDDMTVTEGDLAIAAQDFRDQMAQVPQDQRRGQLIDLLIEIKLSARAAEGLSLDKDPVVVKRLQQVRDRALRVEFIRAKVIGPVTEAAMRKRFQEEVAKFAPADQFSARHILVKTEDEAKTIVADLDKGGDFAAIAKEKSLDPGSKEDGGDLGFFGPGQMVQPFEDAVKGLEVGKYTKTPVQTQFGWHVIRLDEKRKEPAPTFEEQAAGLHDAMVQELFVATMEALRVKAKVEIVGAPPAGTAPAKPADAPPAK